MAASGCSLFGGGQQDVSAEGQIVYACELATTLSENTDFTTIESFIGEDADPAMSEAASTASLVGATAAYTLSDYPDLSEAGREVFSGISRLDLELIDSAIGDMAAECEDVPSCGSPDITPDGQAAYACALASEILEEQSPAETWGPLGEESAWHQVASVGILFGGANASFLEGHEGQAAAGQDLLAGVMQFKVDSIEESLEAIAEDCDH